MKKAIIRIGYRDYVLNTEDAIKVLSVLAEAELYETKWVDENKAYNHYIFKAKKDARENIVDIRLISDETYRLAKLAGDPREGE